MTTAVNGIVSVIAMNKEPFYQGVVANKEDFDNIVRYIVKEDFPLHIEMHKIKDRFKVVGDGNFFYIVDEEEKGLDKYVSSRNKRAHPDAERYAKEECKKLNEEENEIRLEQIRRRDTPG